MIVETRGNLLDDSAEAIVNTVNTEGVSGKGIALQFKLRFPRNYEAYRVAAKQGIVELGRMFVVHTGAIAGQGPRVIINFPTKGHWRAKSRLSDIETGLDDLVRVITELHIGSIALPPLGCGNGGLEWRDVAPLIQSKLGGIDALEVYVYPPEGAPPALAMTVNTAKPRMTPGRAIIIALLRRYLVVADGASRLVVQKLAYIAQQFGAPLRLQFVKAQFGPYAEAVNHVLQATEGHYTVGYGDRTTPSPLGLLPGAGEEAAAYLLSRPELVEPVEAAAHLIEGLESPYGLELLTTVHYVATFDSPPASTLEDAVARVQDWSERKGRLFTAQHIGAVWDHLIDAGLVAKG